MQEKLDYFEEFQCELHNSFATDYFKWHTCIEIKIPRTPEFTIGSSVGSVLFIFLDFVVVVLLCVSTFRVPCCDVNWVCLHIVVFYTYCVVYPMLPLSVDCLFLIASSIFSNVYFRHMSRVLYVASFIELSIFDCLIGIL